MGASLIVTLLLVKWYADATFYAGYDPSAPLAAEIHSEMDVRAYTRTAFEFDGEPGHRVPALLAVPGAGDGPYPCLVLLHGIGLDKDFMEEIVDPFIEAGFAMATFDQYTRGERRLGDVGPWEEAIAFRRRAALTVIETRRLLDYLETRGDIDPSRIYLLGTSYGAITGAVAAAQDTRLQAVVLCYGGGHLPTLLASPAIEEELGRWAAVAVPLVAWFLAPADPVHYVGGIAPRPILQQNGTHDQLIPAASARALFEAAREPKELVWYDSDHVGLDPDHVVRVIDDTIAWLNEQDEGAANSGKNAFPVANVASW